MLTLALAVSALTLASSTPTSMDPVSKMYDLRDLAGVLTSPESSPPANNPFAVTFDPVQRRSVPILSDIPLVGNLFKVSDPIHAAGDPAASGSANPIEPPPKSPTDELVSTLCGLLMLSSQELVEGVYFIDGEEADHKKFVNAVESVRGLYQDRVQIEVSCYDTDLQQPTNIGDAAPKNENPGMSAKAVAIRKTLVRVQATRTISYISRWTPIVGDSAVALEPGTSSVNEGLALGVRVTPTSPAGGGGRDRQRVSVQGVIRKVDIASVQIPADQAMAAANTTLSPGGPLVTIGLPRIDSRVVDTDVTLEMNRATVVATLPGFKEGRQIIIAVTLKNAE